MKKVILTIIIISIAFLSVFGWGFFAHKRINQLAVFILPEPLIGFYKIHIDYITKHATDPDKRRYIDPDEGPKHFFDADHYGKNFDEHVPIHWNDALKKIGKDTLEKHGILPWNMVKSYYILVAAFKAEDTYKILKYSAELGHYISDACVPLHTTENYNGQLTNQIGIHGFWESRLPELFEHQYQYWVGRAEYIHDINRVIWEIIKESHQLSDSVLIIEKNLNNQYESDKKYGYERRGQKLVQVYSIEYATAYHKRLDQMVEKRMQRAVKAIADIWYTAWIEAGQPDLKNVNKNQTKPADSIEALPEKRKMIGRNEE